MCSQLRSEADEGEEGVLIESSKEPLRRPREWKVGE